jgi:hypothetical protein
LKKKTTPKKLCELNFETATKKELQEAC